MYICIMTEKGFLYKRLKIELYSNYILNIIVAKDFSEIPFRLREKTGLEYIDNYDFDGLHINNSRFPHSSSIILEDNASVGIIAHEAFHATINIMKNIGSNLDESSEEPYAYLLTYITNECMNVINRYKKINTL